MVTYAVKQTWSGAWFQLSLSRVGLDQCVQLPSPSFDIVVTIVVVDVPVDLGARIVKDRSLGIA